MSKRRVKSLKVAKGYQHREHRSKRGRKRARFKEDNIEYKNRKESLLKKEMDKDDE